MKIIRSKDNPTYKFVNRLLKRKYRDETGMYLIEGLKPIKDAVSAGVGIKTLIVCDGDCTIYDNLNIECSDYDTVILEEKLFRNLADTKTSQGIIAVSEKKEYGICDLDRILGSGNENIIVLDRLQDPGNMGTIIRTAEAAGYCGVLIMPGCADIYSSKAARAAAGSLFRMPIIYGDKCDNVVRELKRFNRKIAVTSLDTDVFYYDTDISENTALVIGNEGQGVSGDFIKLSDIKIKIPMKGSIESLNAAVAAGILMYQSCGIK
ncbi:MAG: TrmH family RNA methyltransferase [Anaerovoracaceae bacterium]